MCPNGTTSQPNEYEHLSVSYRYLRPTISMWNGQAFRSFWVNIIWTACFVNSSMDLRRYTVWLELRNDICETGHYSTSVVIMWECRSTNYCFHNGWRVCIVPRLPHIISSKTRQQKTSLSSNVHCLTTLRLNGGNSNMDPWFLAQQSYLWLIEVSLTKIAWK